MTVCHYCAAPLNPSSRYIWRRVVGWERKATASSRRSGSDIALREHRDEFACDVCVRRLQSGVAPAQGAML